MKRVLFTVALIIAASSVCTAQQPTYYFPQVAVGGGWKTTIFVSNVSAAGTTASGSITLTKSDGSPFAANWTDESGNLVGGGGNTIAFQLGSGESRKFSSVGDIPLTTGYATVTANASVLGGAMFTQFGADGRMIAEAGVPMAIALGRQAVFVDTTGGFKTGVAIANPNNAALDITFELVSNTGQIIRSLKQPLGPSQHVAFFVHELFPDAPGMVGRLQFYCTNPMTAVALRFDPGFALFTTMAPIAIAN
jgi:hypothetical protein